MKAQTAFAAAFIAALFLPPLLLDRTSVVSQKENRNLAQKPAIIKDGGMNRDYFSQFDAWLSDRFGLRNALIAIDSHFSGNFAAGFTMSGRALEGKDGWIFYTRDNNIADFYKTNLLDENAISKIESNVHETIEWCTNNGIKVMYLIAPNKHSVYGEYYPVARPEGITRADQIAAAITSGGADCLFLRDLLLEKKATAPFRLYFKTDTHWNSLGAYYAYEVLREKIEALFPETRFPAITYRIDIEDKVFSGGTIPMLNKPGMEESGVVLVTPDGAEFEDFYKYIMPEDCNVSPISLIMSMPQLGSVRTYNKDSALPRALVFRDSFFTALEPFVSPLFSEVDYVWKDFTEADKERILAYKPDIVILEHVERFASNLGLVR